MTRRALKPLRRTSAGLPRNAHPARKGGNSRRSVSSSITIAVSDLKRRRKRLMERFFLLLWIGGKHVAIPLPDIVLACQLATDRVLRKALAHGMLYLLLQERNRPIHREVAQPIWGGRQKGAQQRLPLFGPQAWATRAGHVLQSGWIVVSD